MSRMVALMGAALLLPVATALAQTGSGPLVAYGKVGKLPPFSSCRDGAAYKLENSNLRMKDDPGNGVDASSFLGRWVRVKGTFARGGVSPACDQLQLTRIAASNEYLEEKGSTPTPGGVINFTFYGQSGYLHALLMAAGKPARTLLPLGKLGLLTLPLSGPLHTILTTPIPASGRVARKLPIPNDPALKGRDLTFQSAAAVFRPWTGAYLLNPQVVQIQ